MHLFRRVLTLALLIHWAPALAKQLPFVKPTADTEKPIVVNAEAATAQPAQPTNANTRYILVIDAGSSGSRLHVHAYSTDGSSDLPLIEPSKNLKIKPGLSSFEKDPLGSKEPMNKLIEFAKQNVPMRLWKTTPVHLQATAGLRAIPRSAAEAVLDACRHALFESPFYFESSFAAIISGQEEGMFGWISANYLQGTLHKQNPQSTVGVIEVGGASMQVSFVPKNVHHVDPSKITEVKVGKTSFPLYTHSYLNYGLEKAQELFLQANAEVIEKDGNPCYPPKCPVKPPGFSWETSTGQYEKCFELMDRMFPKKCPKERVTCSFGGVYQPPISSEQFYAIENFYYTSQFFDVLEHPTNLFLELRNKGSHFCKLSWDEMRTHPRFKDVPAGELSKYCFSSAYLVKVLEHGLGLKKPAQNTKVVKAINGQGIDWALGSVVHLVSKHEASPPEATPGIRTQTRMLPHASSCGAYTPSLALLVALVGLYFCFGGSRWGTARAKTIFPATTPSSAALFAGPKSNVL